MSVPSDNLPRAVQAVQRADGVLVTAGAGIGVDSGLSDFREEHGMRRAYPALGRARMGFADIANPKAFIDQPRLAWGVLCASTEFVSHYCSTRRLRLLATDQQVDEARRLRLYQ